MRCALTPDRFVVGTRDGVIGVAVRKRRGFEFRSADDDFAALDRRIFPRARLLVNEVARLARTARGAEMAAVPQDHGLW